MKLRLIAESRFTDVDFDLAELEKFLARIGEGLEESDERGNGNHALTDACGSQGGVLDSMEAATAEGGMVEAVHRGASKGLYASPKNIRGTNKVCNNKNIIRKDRNNSSGDIIILSSKIVSRNNKHSSSNPHRHEGTGRRCVSVAVSMSILQRPIPLLSVNPHELLYILGDLPWEGATRLQKSG